MTNQEFPILDHVPGPRYARVNDFMSRIVKNAQNAGMIFALDPDERAGAMNYPAETLAEDLQQLISGLDGQEGEDLRTYFEIEPADVPPPSPDELRGGPVAVEAVAGMAVKGVQAAAEHNRRLGLDDLFSSVQLTNLEVSLEDAPVDVSRWELEDAARSIYRILLRKRVEHTFEP